MSTSLTKLRLFFHKVCFTVNTLFPYFLETLYAGRVKLCWSVGVLLLRCVSARRPPQNALRSASFRGPERWESEGAKSKLQGDEKEQNQCVDFCG